MNLDNLRRKADKQGFDVTVRETGHLVLTKRGDSALFFISARSLDDPRTVFDAMVWLDRLYAHQRILEIYRVPLLLERHRRQTRTVVLWLIVSAMAVNVWSRYRHWWSAGVSFIIFVVSLVLLSLVLDQMLRRRRGK
jgi:hypothetical protein